MSDATAALLLLRQELVLAGRSRWLQVFAAAFALLALAVAASGRVLVGGQDLQRFARTSASLVQLVVLAVPLVSLLVGAVELVPDRGAAELLFSQPISRRAVLLGRYLGLLAALAAAELLGFGVAGLVIFWRAGPIGAGAYAQLVLATVLLTAAFLSVAAFIAAGAGRSGRMRALALALVTWMVAVVLVDLGALALAAALPSADASRVLVASVLLNPAACVRTGALLAVEGASVFGAGTLALVRITGGAVQAGTMLAVSVVAWIVLPLWAAFRRIQRVDL